MYIYKCWYKCPDAIVAKAQHVKVELCATKDCFSRDFVVHKIFVIGIIMPWFAIGLDLQVFSKHSCGLYLLLRNFPSVNKPDMEVTIASSMFVVCKVQRPE